MASAAPALPPPVTRWPKRRTARPAGLRAGAPPADGRWRPPRRRSLPQSRADRSAAPRGPPGSAPAGPFLMSPGTAAAVPPAMSGKTIVQSQFDRAANLVNMETYMRRILLSPFREMTVELPVRMDDGRIEVFTGYRIQHNGARGPCKGGIRYHPHADRDEVLGLA